MLLLSLFHVSQGQGSRVQPMHVVVSLGTGKMPVQEVKNVDVYRPEGIFDVAKVVFGARELAELMIDQVRGNHTMYFFHWPRLPRGQSFHNNCGLEGMFHDPRNLAEEMYLCLKGRSTSLGK